MTAPQQTLELVSGNAGQSCAPLPGSGDIYVDEPKFYPIEARRRGGAQRYTHWSHLWTEAGNEGALHAFAARLGLKREWFQDKPGFPHYDITQGKVARAHRMGALRLALRHWLEWKRRCHQNDPFTLERGVEILIALQKELYDRAAHRPGGESERELADQSDLEFDTRRRLLGL